MGDAEGSLVYLILKATDTLFDEMHWIIVHSLKSVQVISQKCHGKAHNYIIRTVLECDF